MISESSDLRFKCVVVGASAGGVEALTSFFQNLPVTPSLTYVVALHISSKYPSALAEIIGRVAKMPTSSLENSQQLSPGQIYIIPPGADVELVDGRIGLIKTVRDNRPHPDISKLFESFAVTFGRHLIAIVLSGTGSDGSMGAQVVKSFGGLVLAQDSQSSKYTAMPENVLNTGVVDEVLSPVHLAKLIGKLASEVGGTTSDLSLSSIDHVTKMIRLAKGI